MSVSPARPPATSDVSSSQRRSVSIDRPSRVACAVEQVRDGVELRVGRGAPGERLDQLQLRVRAGLGGPRERRAGGRPRRPRWPRGARARRTGRARWSSWRSSTSTTEESVSCAMLSSTRSTKSRAGVSPSRVASQAAVHTRVRGSESSNEPSRSIAAASESASSRILAYARSSSLTSTSAGRGTPTSCGHLGARAVDVELDVHGAGQPAVVEVVAADREAVRALDGVLVGHLLQDRERRDRAGVVDLDLGAQQRDAGLLEPQAGPRRQVAAAGGLELGEQVAQLGVAPRVLGEVGAHAREELVLAHPRDELLEHARALGVGDAVEVDLDVLEVAHVGDDRVRRGQLVLAVGPVLLERRERGPGARPARGLGGRERRHVLGERLVQPQVVPPAHRHEVAEPHVRELVQDRHRAALDRGLGDLGAEHVGLEERHRARVLHRAGVELRHEELVVLGERVRDAEGALVERRSRRA